MSETIHRYFHTVHDHCVYRIYVTSSDLLCVPVASPLHVSYTGAAAIGAYAAASAAWELAEEGEAKRGEAGIRIHIKAMKRGYQLDPDDLDDVVIDYVDKWKQFLLLSPSPALMVNHKQKGSLTFLFQQKKDVVIGLYELQQLFSDAVDVRLNLDDYKKAINKYKNIR